MKKIILLSCALSCFLSPVTTKAQVPIVEKPYEVSRKAKNGYLGGIEMNKEKETIDMVYILPSLLPRKVKTEIYTYDKDLNLLNTVREEEWMDKVKTRWKWFNYKGDRYSTINLTASVDNTGKVVFRQKQITYSYNWYYGRYTKKVKQLEKIKPKTETDSKYTYRASYEVESDSTILVLAGRTEKKTHKAWTHFDLLMSDNNVNIKTLTTLEFKNPQNVCFSAALKDDNEALSNDDFARDWILIFSPSGMFKDDRDPKPTNYTYVRISPQGQIVERFNFDSPSNGWRVCGAYEKDGSVFLYGPAITKDPTEKYMDKIYNGAAMVPSTSASAEEKALAAAQPAGAIGAFAAMAQVDYGQTQEDVDVTLDNLKYTNFQVGKITDSKFDFISSPNIEEFEKKQAKPADQKKFVEFDGKRFVVNGISFTSSGDIFISGQDFVKSKEGQKIYKGIYMFQFEPSGNLKKNYGVIVDQKKKKNFMSGSKLTSDMIIAQNSIHESADGKNLYWLLRNAKTIDTYKEDGYEISEPLYGFDYGSINISTGELSEFKTFGDDEKRAFYLFKNTSSYKMGHNLYFFSETKKGDKILLTKMDLTK